MFNKNSRRAVAMKILKTAILISIFALSSGANAALIVDQVSNDGVSGGIGGDLIQSFTPAADNLAGVDIFVSGSSALVSDVSVFVYSDALLTNLIASDTISDHPRGTSAQLRWDAVSVVPEQLYYFDFDVPDLLLGTSFQNSYTRGEIINSPSPNAKDFFFTTYSDSEFSAVPIPAAAWLFGSALLGLGMVKRRKA